MNTPNFPETSAILTATGKDPARQRPGGRSGRVQAVVFKAAFQLLEEEGYEKLSIAAISKRSGIHETTLYRRWKSKEQLVLDAVSQQLSQEIPVPDTGVFRSDLIEVVQSLRLFLKSREGQALFQTAVATIHLPQLRVFRQEHWQRRLGHLKIIFERAVNRGELAPQEDYQFLLELLSGIVYMRLFVIGEDVDDMLCEKTVNFILSGLKQA